MEKKKVSIIFIFIIIMISIIYFSVFQLFSNHEENEKGITMAEGLQIANDIALDAHKNATLIGAYSDGDMKKNGTFKAWRYNFANLEFWESSLDGSLIPKSTPDIHVIKIYANGNIEEWTLYKQNIPLKFVEEFNIDSNQAYDIARNQYEIENFIKEHDVKMREMKLTNKTNINITWSIEWYYTIHGDPCRDIFAIVYIDASNGEVKGIYISE